jgi:hypothetical protein
MNDPAYQKLEDRESQASSLSTPTPALPPLDGVPGGLHLLGIEDEVWLLVLGFARTDSRPPGQIAHTAFNACATLTS